MPARVPRSVMPRAGMPSTAARANNSSTCEAPRRKEKFVGVWSSMYMGGLRVCSGFSVIEEPFVPRNGFMIHRGRGEEGGRLVAEKLTGRVIGLAIKIHKTLGP